MTHQRPIRWRSHQILKSFSVRSHRNLILIFESWLEKFSRQYSTFPLDLSRWCRLGRRWLDDQLAISQMCLTLRSLAVYSTYTRCSDDSLCLYPMYLRLTREVF